MSTDHSRFEPLAVGHVVGGLDEVEAASFRQHLLSCRECRLRVSELRSIASDLAAAERDERATAARVATEVERRQQEAPPQVDVAPWRAWPWAVIGSAVVVTGLVVVLVWNLSLQTVVARVEDAAVRLEGVLDVLATGDQLEPRMDPGMSGLVAVDDDEIALDLAGVSLPLTDERWVVWQLDADGGALASLPLSVPSTDPSGGRIAISVDRVGGAAQVAVSLEDWPVDVVAPTGRRLMTADLPPGG